MEGNKFVWHFIVKKLFATEKTLSKSFGVDQNYFKKKLFSKKKHLACIFVIFCVCCQIRAAIRKMRLGKSTGPSSKSVKLLGHMKTIELILSKHYSTKSMTQVTSHQTFPNPYL